VRLRQRLLPRWAARSSLARSLSLAWKPLVGSLRARSG
jgi:hypothetical protein